MVTASSGVEKNIVFAVSDEFYITSKGHATDNRVAKLRRAQEHIQAQQEDEELRVQQWAAQLSRRSDNSSYIDNMMGTLSGALAEDMEKPGGMSDFYKDCDVCPQCYNVYRNLDKRRNKMRDAAKHHKAIKPQAASGSLTDDGVMNAGVNTVLGSSQVHGRGLQQEEIWEALGYGRVERKAPTQVVQKQKRSNDKLNTVPAWRDMRVIKKKEDSDMMRKKRKQAGAMQVRRTNTHTTLRTSGRERFRTRSLTLISLVQGGEAAVTALDENGEKLSGVKRLIHRIEKRASKLSSTTEPEKKEMYIGKEAGFVSNIGRHAERERKEMKKMKKELREIEKQEEEEGKKLGDLDVLGGLEWDDAVKQFRGEKVVGGGSKRNVAKVATKIVGGAKFDPSGKKTFSKRRTHAPWQNRRETGTCTHERTRTIYSQTLRSQVTPNWGSRRGGPTSGWGGQRRSRKSGRITGTGCFTRGSGSSSRRSGITLRRRRSVR